MLEWDRAETFCDSADEPRLRPDAWFDGGSIHLLTLGAGSIRISIPHRREGITVVPRLTGPEGRDRRFDRAALPG